MDPQLLSIILSTLSLGFDIKTVIRDYIISNKRRDDILNKAIKKAKRNAGIDSQHLYGKPFSDDILKNELLDLVTKKAKNECVVIPNWLGEKDFEKLYDSIMEDVEFLEFLHQEIETHQHSLQIQKLDESSNKIDKTNELLKKIESQIEILSRQYSQLPEWLRRYEKELSVGVEKSFLDDASENLIRDRKLHFNEEIINKVKHYLNEKKFCMIEAPEGRGKTYLSRIIAYYYRNDRKMEVYFLDLKDHNGIPISNIDDILQEWHKNKSKEYFLVIENAHAYRELEALKEVINGWITPKGNRVWFLLNTRPSYVELDDFSDWKEKVELIPTKEDVNNIIKLYSIEVGREPFANEKERDRFVNKIYPDKKEANGANLRLLRIYLETWQNHPEIEYISGVLEQTVIERFRNKYLKMNNVIRPLDEIKALWYLSSLFQFDVPLHEDFMPNVGSLVADGLLRFEENRYHLPHSVDALFLYKAICDYRHKSFSGQMKIYATSFVEELLKSDNPRDFENDFKLLISGLIARKDEFKEVVRYLSREDRAKEIIMNLNPGFVFFFFHVDNKNDSSKLNSLITYYNKNKDWLTSTFFGFSPKALGLFNVTMKNNSRIIIEDIFKDPEVLGDYLIRQFEKNKNAAESPCLFGKSIRKIIVNISPRHAAVINEFENHFNNFHKTKKYHFVSKEKKDSKIRISNVLVNNEYCLYDKKQFQDFISALCTKGFYFDELTWRVLANVFIRKMAYCFDEAHKESFQKVTKTLVQMIINNDNMFLETPNVLLNSSSALFSCFLCYIHTIDNTLYYETISNAKVIEAVKQKIRKVSKMGVDDLYLFSRFYSQNWCKNAMEKLINYADDEQIETIKQWYQKVKQELDYKHVKLDEASLVAYIQKKFYSTTNPATNLAVTLIEK